VLIVSEDVRNRRTDDVIVIPVFSSGRLGPTRAALPAGSGGIAHGSVLFCEEISTIDHDFLVRGPLGSPVEASVLAQVLRAVRRALGEAVPEP
jgi:mRNA-degrading endonuclease toxin of MazEF toxin-antitoxin module